MKIFAKLIIRDDYVKQGGTVQLAIRVMLAEKRAHFFIQSVNPFGPFIVRVTENTLPVFATNA